MSDAEVARRGDLPGTDLVPHEPPAIMKYLPTFESGVDAEELTAQREKFEAAATTPEDQRVLAAYRALEEGRQMVSLSEALARGQLRNDRMPNLAVLRADLSQVRVRSDSNGTLRFSDPRPVAEGWSERKRRKMGAWSLTFPRIMQTWAADGSMGEPKPRGGTARAPYIPPTVRPKDPENYLVFWEAGPEWTVDPVPVPRPRVHIDPAILEHVVGDFYVVVATWDLTPIESAALDGY